MQSNKPAQDIGQGIREAVNSAVGDVLQSVRDGIAKELASAKLERDAMQRQLNASTPGGNRAALTEKLAEANVKVEKLQAAIDKIDAKTDRFTTSTTPPPSFPPPPGSNDYIPEQMIISIIGIIFIGFPLALTFARIIWKRTSHSPPSASLFGNG